MCSPDGRERAQFPTFMRPRSMTITLHCLLAWLLGCPSDSVGEISRCLDILPWIHDSFGVKNPLDFLH